MLPLPQGLTPGHTIVGYGHGYDTWTRYPEREHDRYGVRVRTIVSLTRLKNELQAQLPFARSGSLSRSQIAGYLDAVTGELQATLARVRDQLKGLPS